LNKSISKLFCAAFFAVGIGTSALAADVQVIDITEHRSPVMTTTPAAPPPAVQVRKVAVIAHRGGRKWGPENTMAAFRKAVEYGCDGIELDIHKCKSGELVVIHDADVSRTTNGTGAVPDLTYDELLKFSAGSRFSHAYTNERIPLLSDVLKLVDGRLVLNIELKNWPKAYPGIDDDLIAMLSQYKYPDKIIISSFDHEMLSSIHSKAPQYKLAVLDSAILEKPKDYCNSVGAQYWHPDFHTLRGDVVQRAKASGVTVNVWTVNDPREWVQAVNWGVDGICTDDPEGLHGFLSKR
jgi:glycerophosphoryl diester phosphodiesterase